MESNEKNHKNIVSSLSDTDNNYENHKVKRRKENQLVNHHVIEEPSFDTCCKCGILMNPKFVLALLALSATIQGIVVNGIMDLITWNLELRFQLSSASSGLIASFYDIGCLIVVIPVTYIAGRKIRLKPRYISIGLFIMGLGSLLCALPHFLTGDYLDSVLIKQTKSNLLSHENSTSDICLWHQKSNECLVKSQDDVIHNSLSDFIYVFFLGQILHGFGATPLQIIGCTLLSDIVSSHNNNSAFYISIFQIFFIVGPGVGFVGGAQLLKIYTDFYKQFSIEDLLYLKKSRLFVGAWWIGLIFCWIMSWICGLIFYIYTPKNEETHLQTEMSSLKKEEKVKKLTNCGIAEKFSDIIICTKSLLSNPSYVFCAIGEISNQFCVGFMATFMPKILSILLKMKLEYIGALYGTVVLGTAIVSSFISGLVIKLFKLNLAGVLKMCIICQILAAIFATGIMVPCSDTEIVGLNNLVSVSSLECNDTCFPCSTMDYSPVCNLDTHTNYLNPCFAGCNSTNSGRKSKSMDKFACVCYNNTSTELNRLELAICDEPPCLVMPFTITVYGISTFFLIQTFTPGLVAVLKIVRPDQQTFGLGLAAFFVRLLGMIPGPIVFGKMIDLACNHWQTLDNTNCNNSNENTTKGSCRIYDKFKLSFYLLIAILVTKMIHIGAYTLAFFFSKKKLEHITKPAFSLN